MPPRQLFHCLLAVPALAGIAVALVLVAQASRTKLSEESTATLAASAWQEILAAIPAEMPGEYFVEGESPETIEDLSPEQQLDYPRSNAFLVSCSLLVLLGAVGIGLTGHACRRTLAEPAWYGAARTLAMFGFTLTSFLLVGFSIAFPGDNFGIFPKFSPYAPGELDSIAYGLNGITEWSDLFYTGTYSLFFGCLLVSFCQGGMRATPAFLVALPAATLFFPLVVSWKWGGGWLDQLGNTYDFAGAALLHWHAGSVALLVGLFLTLARRPSFSAPAPVDRPGSNAASPGLLFGGGIATLLGLVGLNGGSTLEATPSVVAPVLQATVIATLVSGLLAAGWAFVSTEKPILRYAVFGAIAGAVAASGAADLLDRNGAIAVGAITGLIVPGVVLLADRFGWVDPLAVGPVHGIGGAIGVISAAFVGREAEFSGTPLGQLILLVTTPIASIAAALVILLLALAVRWLIRIEPNGNPDETSPASESSRSGPPRGGPPPLPRPS